MATICRPITEARKVPPCRAACPADVNVQGYVALIQQGRFRESVELIRKSMPFPAICGRVCVSPCQDACTRKDIDHPVGIRFLKRLAADIENEQGSARSIAVPKTHTEKIAVIGAGPAGLSAAYELAKLGYPVTIFERHPEAGGMMRYGIPDYRLRKYVVAQEITYINDLGVEIKTGAELGKDFQLETLPRKGYNAVFIAIGAQLSQPLEIPGEDLDGVHHAVDFLREVASGKAFHVGERVAVLGGGNTAVDAARTALRLGAENVTILYRRSRREMPALPDEIEAAEAEGVRFEFLVSPTRILGKNGKATTIECQRMRLGEPDASGRRRPIPIQGSGHFYAADTILPAIGQRPDTSSLPSTLFDERARTIAVDPLTFETAVPAIFAGGDVTSGPASVIKAVGAGKQAAISIDRYLTGQDLRAERSAPVEETSWVQDWSALTKKPERYLNPQVDVGRQEASFDSASRLLAKNKELAILEARRCLECGPCTECLGSEGLCEAGKASIDEAKCTGCNICSVVCPFGAVGKNEMGIAVVNDGLCKGCGLCSASCPERAITINRLTNAAIIDVDIAPRRTTP